MTHVRGTMENEAAEAITILVTPVWKDSARLAVFGKELADELADLYNIKVELIKADLCDPRATAAIFDNSSICESATPISASV